MCVHVSLILFFFLVLHQANLIGSDMTNRKYLQIFTGIILTNHVSIAYKLTNANESPFFILNNLESLFQAAHQKALCRLQLESNTASEKLCAS